MVEKTKYSRAMFLSSMLGILLTALSARAAIDLQIRGNESVSNRVVRRQLPEYPSEWTKEEVQLWREDAIYYVEQYYQQRGYFDVQIRIQTIRRNEKSWQAFMDVNEGTRYAFGPVQVIIRDTLESVPQSLIDTSRLNVKRNEFYSETPILKDRRLILRAYGDAGYVHAQVQDSVSINDTTNTVLVKYVVRPSYAVVFDTLIIHNTREVPLDSLEGITNEQLLRDLFPYSLGDTVRARENDGYIEKLQSTGIFNFVRLRDTLLQRNPNRSAVILVAEEHVPGELGASVFYETQYGLGVSLDLSHGNIKGTMNEIRMGGTFATDKQSAYAGFGAPLIFDYLVRFDTDLEVAWYQDDEVHKEADAGLFGGSFEAISNTRLSRTITEWARFVTSAELYALQGAIIPDQDAIIGDTLEGVTLNFINTVSFTFLNDLLHPTDGTRYAVTWGNGGALIESGRWELFENRYNWFELISAYYYPIIPQIRMAARINGGIFLDEGGLDARRFYLGGPRGVRAFGFREIEPATGFIDDGVTPLYFLASLEARVGLFDFGYINENSFFGFLTDFDIVPFVDYGRLYDLTEPFDDPLQKDGWAMAYGVGLRYPLLGIFNLRVDFAWGYTYQNGERISARDFDPQTFFGLPLPFTLVIDLSQAF